VPRLEEIRRVLVAAAQCTQQHPIRQIFHTFRRHCLIFRCQRWMQHRRRHALIRRVSFAFYSRTDATVHCGPVEEDGFDKLGDASLKRQ